MKQFLLFIFLLLGVVATQAGVPQGWGSPGNGQPPAPSVAQCQVGTARAELDINNVRTTIFNDGSMWWDELCCARYEIPKITDPNQVRRHSMFAASVWVGGQERGTNNIFLMAQTYRDNAHKSFWPGPIDSITTFTNAARCSQYDKMFKLNRTTVDDHKNKLLLNGGRLQNTSDVDEAILKWPGRGNPYLRTFSGFAGINTNFSMARFNDVDSNGIYDPLNGDSPQLPGAIEGSTGADQVIFFIMNDAGNNKVFDGLPVGTASIGMEVQTEAFEYTTSDYVNDMTFYRQKLINKGTTILANCYFGQWADPDLGNPSDDYVGFDVIRGLAICYNGDDNDEGNQGYGINPPSIAIDFFKGPMADPNDGIDNDRDSTVDEPGELIISSNFVYYNNTENAVNGNPTGAIDYYNFLRSIWRGTNPHMTYDGGDGTTIPGQPGKNNNLGIPSAPCNFMFPGTSDAKVGWGVGGTPTRPVATREWSEVTAHNPPGDRRMLTSAGSFTLIPGATNELTIGVVWARSSTGGATGSFNKLLTADDAAQKLFDNDFKILSGPDAPDVQIVEANNELQFTLVPHSSNPQPGRTITTESYVERDFNNRLRNPYYRFQGYLVYQLLDASVSFGELDNPDRARLLANVSSDIKDGVKTIINSEYDDGVAAFVPRLKVSGTDGGLIHTFSIKTDEFPNTANGKLVNFRNYFFTVLAYGYNPDPNQDVKFLLGRLNRKVYIAMPHPVQVERSGFVLQSSFGESLAATRLQGVGNGGNTLDTLDGEDESAIVTNGAKLPIKYSQKGAPISVKVYSPKSVVAADLTYKLYTRVTYRGSASKYQVGDTIQSIWKALPTYRPSDTNSRFWQYVKLNPSLLQKAGLAKVVAVRPRKDLVDSTLIDLEVMMLNDVNGGRFTTVLSQQDKARGDFLQYVYIDRPFAKRDNGVLSSDTTTCIDYGPYEFWRLFSGPQNNLNLEDFSQRPSSLSPDQVVPKYGLLVTLKNPYSPGTFPFINPVNGYQLGSIRYGQPKSSLAPVANNPAVKGQRWFNLGGVFSTDATNKITAVDITGALRNFLSGSLAPYSYTAYYAPKVDSAGAQYPNAPDQTAKQVVYTNVATLSNVDVVITPDKSKWTRCVVIQGDSTTARQTAFFKSRLSSVDNEYRPTGALSPYADSASRGMSYFPGYAIDLDKGIRLNMAFLESRFNDINNGNNLKWEPQYIDPQIGGTAKNYVYVFKTQYDEGKDLERTLDSVTYSRAPSIANGTKRQQLLGAIWGQAMWVANLTRSNASVDFLASQTRLLMRVDRTYASYPDTGGDGGVPTYTISTKGLESIAKVTDTARNALASLRVVPNPYYAYSTYENSQIDTRVRIINMPTKATVSIFNLAGSLIRQYRVDNSTFFNTRQESAADATSSAANGFQVNQSSYLDWDLKNQTNLPVSSGVYLIHVAAPGLGEVTLKFMAVLRPTDLDSISQ